MAERTAELIAASEEIRRGAARLVEVEALRAKLIANLSHELRTPLSLVVGPLEALRGRLTNPGPEIDRWLRLMQSSGTRLTELLGQLLDVSKLDRGELGLRARRLDLAAFVRDTSERFIPAAASAGLKLAIDVPGNSLPAWFDPDLLDKAITNLLGNALKYTPQGSIQVRVAHHEPYVHVEVEDTGPGIAPAEQQRLFARFERLDVHESVEGAGIGLALTRELVELHGGDVGVRSSVGAGSTFWIRLPTGSEHLDLEDIDPDPSPAGSGQPLPAEEPKAEGPRERGAMPPAGHKRSEASEGAAEPLQEHNAPALVLVEDHNDMRAFLAEQFGHRFSVTGFADAESALEACRPRPPAVVVSDVMMPGMGGIELCRRLRADPATAAVPVVLLSALAGSRDLDEGLAVATDYVTKPFHTGALLARVSAAAGLPERREQPLGQADSAFLDRAHALVGARLGEADFGVTQMARELGYSRRQLLRLLRRLTGSSPSEFLLDHRLARARQLLHDRTLTTAAEVAIAVGLSPSYFSRVYRARFGTTPMARRD